LSGNYVSIKTAALLGLIDHIICLALCHELAKITPFILREIVNAWRAIRRFEWVRISHRLFLELRWTTSADMRLLLWQSCNDGVMCAPHSGTRLGYVKVCWTNQATGPSQCCCVCSIRWLIVNMQVSCKRNPAILWLGLHHWTCMCLKCKLLLHR